MREKLQKLLDLQDLDLRIGKLQRIKENLTRSISEEKALHSSRLEDLESEKTHLKKLQSDIKQYEIELEVLQEKRKKLESQQAAVKTNQEYKALSKEILDTLAEVDRTEEAMLGKLEESDTEKGRLAELQKEVAAEEEKLSAETVETEKEVAEIDGEIARLSTDKDAIVPVLDSSTLRTYQKVFERTGGPAVVPVVNRTCGGCHLSVTAQIENLTRRNEDLILCENCARILYYKPAEEETESNEEAERQGA